MASSSSGFRDPHPAHGLEPPERLLNKSAGLTAGRCLALGSFVLADHARVRHQDVVVHANCRQLMPAAAWGEERSRT